MNCLQAQGRLAGYLDGALSAQERPMLRAHIESCGDCRQQLEEYRLLAMSLASVDRVAPPPGLASRIQRKISYRDKPWAAVSRIWHRALLISQNILEPLAVPATGGLLTAVAVFVLAVQSMLMGLPPGGVAANDLPLDLIQPARLESLAPFPLPGMGADGHSGGTLLLEATLDAQGEVVFYKILSGPVDIAARHQIDQVLLFSRFRPQLGFGVPMGGGHVFLNFSEVRVRG